MFSHRNQMPFSESSQIKKKCWELLENNYNDSRSKVSKMTKLREREKESERFMLCVLWVTTGASEDAIGKTLNVAIKPAVFRCDCLNLWFNYYDRNDDKRKYACASGVL